MMKFLSMYREKVVQIEDEISNLEETIKKIDNDISVLSHNLNKLVGGGNNADYCKLKTQRYD